MAPWPRALVIPQLVENAGTIDDIVHVKPAGETITLIERWEFTTIDNLSQLLPPEKGPFHWTALASVWFSS
ncbi:hypothetical protein TNCV_536691 [Trichonephila clavipes]|nr:hypothetical protein TNCV_536691 [Trichonephila clavipes]